MLKLSKKVDCFLKHKSRFVITTPIFYTNAPPHIGHFYTCLIADSISRMLRCFDKDVFCSTGTDEHGQKILQSAKLKGKSPKEFVDDNHLLFSTMMNKMQFGFDKFTRTTSDEHKRSAINLWKTIEKNGHIYKGDYSGWYSLREESFLPDSEVENGFSKDGEALEYVSESSYFFNLSNWSERLLEFCKSDAILPLPRRNEMLSFVSSGLKDISISRKNLEWGISITNEDTMYVWIDALSNYLTALGYPDKESKVGKYWDDDNSTTIHIVGKDILRFHAIYWPAMLAAANIALPKKILAHGWWLNDGKKMSKSLNNSIDPINLFNEFGVDETRYFFLRESSISSDGNFSRDIMIERINSDLVCNFGNLVNRTLKMVVTYLDSDNDVDKVRVFSDKLYQDVSEKIESFLSNIVSHIESLKINDIIKETLSLSSFANRFIDQLAPWSIYKAGDMDKLHYVLFNVLKLIHIVSISFHAFMPNKLTKALEYIGAKNKILDFVGRDEYIVSKRFNHLFSKIDKVA